MDKMMGDTPMDGQEMGGEGEKTVVGAIHIEEYSDGTYSISQGGAEDGEEGEIEGEGMEMKMAKNSRELTAMIQEMTGASAGKSAQAAFEAAASEGSDPMVKKSGMKVGM